VYIIRQKHAMAAAEAAKEAQLAAEQKLMR